MSTNTPISRNAKHILREDEVEQIKETLLGALQSKKEIEAEKKEVANTYKTKIAEQELAIDKASNLLRVGYEHRPFQCYLVKNFETGKREYIEFGTERLIDSEPLNTVDYQTEMEMAEATIRKNNELADLAVELLHSGNEPEPFGLTAEEIEAAEAGSEYTVEPDSNPLEMDFEETPAVEPEVKVEPLKVVKGGKSKTTDKTGTQSLNEHLSADDFDDPFSNLGSRDNALDLGNDMDDDSDPFDFGDI